MLKDLEQRKAPQDESASNYAASVLQSNTPSYKLIITLIVFTAAISIAATYFIQNNLNNENVNSVPEKSTTAKVENIPQTPPIKVTEPEVSNIVVAKNIAAPAPEDKVQTNTVKQVKTPKVEEVAVVSKPSQPVKQPVVVESNDKVEVVAVTPITISTTTDETKSSDKNLVISQVELTPQQLSLKKLNQAKRYLNDNKLNKAQAWLEEAIILDPYNVQARKQLAALWFGGKSYNQAINLLSQGLALSPNNEEYRLMLARLYSTIGNNDKAFAVLNEFSQSKLLEYQLALANIAAQTDHHVEAISAYQKLLAMRPTQGLWWLGMAISLDSNEDYGQAIVAYKEAIASNRLSKNSKQFAKQRLAELGE